jgi:hypothetical protein
VLSDPARAPATALHSSTETISGKPRGPAGLSRSLTPAGK